MGFDCVRQCSISSRSRLRIFARSLEIEHQVAQAPLRRSNPNKAYFRRSAAHRTKRSISALLIYSVSDAVSWLRPVAKQASLNIRSSYIHILLGCANSLEYILQGHKVRSITSTGTYSP